jgi:segregation and condensation protein B
MDELEIKHFLEAALLASGRPLSVDQLQQLFDGRSTPEKSEIRKAVQSLNDDYEQRGIMIAEVASGFRIQVKASMAERLQKLWEERPPRYSRALFETLALVAYRQPVTRGEIEEIRGVSVSSNIVRTLIEREWVRVVGHRDVPGRPEMFGTTRAFLDYFGLKKLDDLPPLADLSDWESLRVQLNLPEVEDDQSMTEQDVRDLPVLLPEIAIEGADVPGNDASDAAAESVAELPDRKAAAGDTPEDVEEDLVVSEWPDPADSTG